MTATAGSHSNVTTLPFRPRLLDAPPEIKRPEPRDSHDIEHVTALETEMLLLEIKQRAYVLAQRIGRDETTMKLAEVAGQL